MNQKTKNIDGKGLKYGQIMGINVASTSIDAVLTRVNNFISDNYEFGSRSSNFSIFTPNPELILMAQDNPGLKEALNSAELSIPDGIGLKIADKNLNIIKGRELFLKLVEMANRNKWRIFLLGGLDSEAEIASGKLAKTFDNLEIDFEKGPHLDKNGEPVTEFDRKIEKDVIDKINRFTPEFLFVAFGNPKQEIWIHKNLPNLKIGGAMAVGGTFRYVAGLSKLPPKWMEKIGLEWLFRLITEPGRITRVFNAVVKFPLAYIFYDKKKTT